MIYLVTNQPQLFENDIYKIIGVEESLRLLEPIPILSADSETTGRDPHVNTLISFQIGNKDIQVVIDCTTIDITEYKNLLESKYLIFQNGAFDLQFLYNYGIVPRKIYDTMIVEQLLHLGFPKGQIKYSLQAIAERRLDIYISKDIRGQIIWRGFDTEVIQYAATDIVYLEDIMRSQLEDCKKKECLVGAKLECDSVPWVAYLMWCGIKLDINKWQAKMQKDKNNLEEAIKALDNYVLTNPKLAEFHYYNNTLFEEFSGEVVTVKWSSPQQVIKVAKALGFNTNVTNKKGEDVESVMEKHLASQKGIDDTFLKLYLGKGEPDDINYYPGYRGSFKVCTSFGQGHLNAINPNTGRIHTVYRQLGTITGRMSSGSTQNNDDLAKLKNLPINPSNKQKQEGKGCSYPNMQQLPHDATTRGCFVSEENNLFCSCDYAAMEARIGADVYNEQMLLDEFLLRSGDTHAAYAKVVFAKELEGIEVKDIKKKRPDLRSKVKSVEFAVSHKCAA